MLSFLFLSYYLSSGFIFYFSFHILLFYLKLFSSFFTYRSSPWLNNKHTVFGRVVGGLETLRVMESVPTDESNDRPKMDIKLLETEVFVNPFSTLDDEANEEKRKEEEAMRKKDDRYSEEGRGSWYSNPAPAPLKTTKTGVGKYLPAATSTANTTKANSTVAAATKRKAPDSSSTQPPVKKTA